MIKDKREKIWWILYKSWGFNYIFLEIMISFQEGDEVDVSESLGNGWLYGRECLSGRYGQFPEAFVRAV